MIHSYITDFATQEKLEKTRSLAPKNHSRGFSSHSSSIKLFYFACGMKIKVIMEEEGIIS